MRFLRRFVLILETAGLVVTLSVCINDLTLNAFHGRIAQVHAVGTHVRDVTTFVQFLSDEHGPTHSIPEFTTGFLLQGGCCERGGRCFLRRLDLYIRYLVSSTYTGFEEYLCILFGLISCAFRLEIDVLPIDVRSGEPCIQFETAFRMECVDGPFPLSDQPDGHTLNPSRTQVVPHAHFAPQHRGQLKSYDTVKDPAGLLRVHEVHVHRAGRLYCRLDRGLGDLMENDPLGGNWVQSEHLAQVPADRFSLAVLIRCQPDLVRLPGDLLQFPDNLFLVFRYDIPGFVSLLDINAHVILLQIPDVSKATFYLEIIPEYLFNGLCLGRRLNDQEIFGHT